MVPRISPSSRLNSTRDNIFEWEYSLELDIQYLTKVLLCFRAPPTESFCLLFYRLFVVTKFVELFRIFLCLIHIFFSLLLPYSAVPILCSLIPFTFYNFGNKRPHFLFMSKVVSSLQILEYLLLDHLYQEFTVILSVVFACKLVCFFFVAFFIDRQNIYSLPILWY